MSNVNIICAGGGNNQDAKILDEHFASWFRPGDKLLYWPFATDGHSFSYSSCFSWLSSVFNPLGIEHICMWTELNSHTPAELNDFNGIYIGGGNTFRLLRHIRQQGWFDPLKKFIEAGRPTYGGSAGALILGHNMRTTHDTNDKPDMTFDLGGLNLIAGYAIWCHYQEVEDSVIYKYVQRNDIPVLACSEQSGIVSENGRISAAGSVGVYRFGSRDKTYIKPGSDL